MRKLHLSLALVALCLLAVACGDDDPVKPAEFAVVIHVTDPDGNPVEDLRVGMVNDNPFFPDKLTTTTAVMEGHPVQGRSGGPGQDNNRGYRRPGHPESA